MNKISIFCVASLILLCAVRFTLSAPIGDRKMRTPSLSDRSKFHSDGIITNYNRLSNNSRFNFDEKFDSYYAQLQTLNISNYGIKNLLASNLTDPNIRILDVSYNKLDNISGEIFINTPAITEINFAHNQLTTLHSDAFKKVTKLTTLSFAHNQIIFIENETFSTLRDLNSVDLSDNQIEVIDADLFKYNTNLRELWLENNPIQRFDEQIFWPIVNLPSVMLYVSCENALEMDTSHYGGSLEWQVSADSGILLKSSKSLSHMECIRGGNFANIRHFNCSGNGLQNTSDVIDMLGSSIESLDLSSNNIGEIDAHTFKRFTNLKYLNLSDTQLMHFGFDTFYHQRRLRVLDISYNQLGSVNFTLFFRVFRNLFTLNLEGNGLNEVDSVTKAIFPKLMELGISKNHFTCDYLSKFLRQWESLRLLDNPSMNQMHIDGIDCFGSHDNEAPPMNVQRLSKFVEQQRSVQQQNRIYRGQWTKPKQVVSNPNVQYLIPNLNQPVGTWHTYQNMRLSQPNQGNSIVYPYPIYYYTNRFV